MKQVASDEDLRNQSNDFCNIHSSTPWLVTHTVVDCRPLTTTHLIWPREKYPPEEVVTRPLRNTGGTLLVSVSQERRPWCRSNNVLPRTRNTRQLEGVYTRHVQVGCLVAIEKALTTNDIGPRNATHLAQSEPAHKNGKVDRRFVRHGERQAGQFYNVEIDNTACKRTEK